MISKRSAPAGRAALCFDVARGVMVKPFEDAVFSVIDAIPGQGVVYNRMNVERRTITSESLAILRHKESRQTQRQSLRRRSLQ